MGESSSHQLLPDQAVNVNMYGIGMSELFENRSLFCNCGGDEGNGSFPVNEIIKSQPLISGEGDKIRMSVFVLFRYISKSNSPSRRVIVRSRKLS